MQTQQAILESASPSQLDKLAGLAKLDPQLVLIFGSLRLLQHQPFLDHLYRSFPAAQIVGCSTAGEISSAGVGQGSVVVTAIRFRESSFRVTTAELSGMTHSYAAGEQLARGLHGIALKAVLVLGQGVNINGSALVKGMAAILGQQMPIFGGLAGDDDAFKATAILGAAGLSASSLIAVGFYGDKLVHSCGSFGGWQPFGLEQKVTRCSGNILHQLDGEPALTVYKRHLGDYAKGLPAAGLLFPFEMVPRRGEPNGLIRSILGIDEASDSLILAGEIDPDSYLRLMFAQTDRLVEGAEVAAQRTKDALPAGTAAGLALLISCVGRRLVMGSRVQEEVEAVATVLGAKVTLSGFYSYGEICPVLATGDCQLQNQTMTIAYLAELPGEG